MTKLNAFWIFNDIFEFYNGIIKNFFAEISLADLVPDPNPDLNPEPNPDSNPEPNPNKNPEPNPNVDPDP